MNGDKEYGGNILRSEQTHVSLIILNWNGWNDTIECLESVLKSKYENYHIILIDNFSEDNSIVKIKAWALKDDGEIIKSKFPHLISPKAKRPLSLFELFINNQTAFNTTLKKELPNTIPDKAIILVHNSENVGFAAGNNIGIKIDSALFKSSYLYHLNNDTVIEPDTIPRLLNYLNDHPSVGAATSAIYNYFEPQTIANMGGRLTPWASRRYYTEAKDCEKNSVTFLTGCALMVRKTIFDRLGLFSEKFFFGEEDYEFSLRLRKNKVKVTCVNNSRLYHKEASSSKKLYSNNLKKKFIHYFNRMINMRDYYSLPVWCVWKWLMIFYIFYCLIFRNRTKLYNTLIFLILLEKSSRKYQDAKKITVKKIYNELRL